MDRRRFFALMAAPLIVPFLPKPEVDWLTALRAKTERDVIAMQITVDMSKCTWVAPERSVIEPCWTEISPGWKVDISDLAQAG